MSDIAWIEHPKADIELLTEALAILRSAAPDRADESDRLAERLAAATPPPSITVGVYGGLVQGVTGNPFPIRIIDYDGDEDDLLDRDDGGLPCSIWEALPELPAATVA